MGYHDNLLWLRDQCVSFYRLQCSRHFNISFNWEIYETKIWEQISGDSCSNSSIVPWNQIFYILPVIRGSAALWYRTFFLISFIYVEKISPFQLFLGVYYYITKMLINYNARWKNRVKLKKSSKSHHQKTFTLCTCLIFDHFCQCFISGTENGYNALSPTNVENLVVS